MYPRMMPHMHKVFVSYHHARDQEYADAFRDFYGAEDAAFLDRSLLEAVDSNNTEYIMSIIRTEGLKESTATIVLVGLETRLRKYVDWEIYSSLRPGPRRTRNGLLGILLPGASKEHLPPRFLDNYRESKDGKQIGYAKLIPWDRISPPATKFQAWWWGDEEIKRRKKTLSQWIHAAYLNRENKAMEVDITTTPRFAKNRPA